MIIAFREVAPSGDRAIFLVSASCGLKRANCNWKRLLRLCLNEISLDSLSSLPIRNHTSLLHVVTLFNILAQHLTTLIDIVAVIE